MDDFALREPSLKQKTQIKRWSHCERGQEGDSWTVSPVQNSIQNTQTNHSSVSSSEVSARCLEEVHSAAAHYVLLMSMLAFYSPKTSLIIEKSSVQWHNFASLSLSLLTRFTNLYFCSIYKMYFYFQNVSPGGHYASMQTFKLFFTDWCKRRLEMFAKYIFVLLSCFRFVCLKSKQSL